MNDQSIILNKLKNELAELKDKMQIAVSVARLGFWEYNYKNKRIILSDEVAEITGLDKGVKLSVIELIKELCDANTVNQIKQEFERVILGNEDIDFEFTFTRPSDYKKVTVKVVATAINNKEKSFERLFGTVQDITVQKISEEQLKNAKEKAEEADQLKSAFLANMSHEIRTPLNAILGFSRLLINKNIPDIQRREYSEYITNSANNLLNLIRDIVDVSKIEAGKINIEKKACFVNKILKELKMTFKNEKQNNEKDNIDLILKVAKPDEDFAILSDPFRFNQIFINLLGNALKFIESGFIEFGYISTGKGYLQFYVKDTGIGIPVDRRDLIFSRFGQIVNKKIKNPGGTGLGLSITRYLVENLGGKIWYESELNVGTTFYFTLPLDEISSEKKHAGYTTEQKEIGSELSILAVEDDPLNMVLLIDTLSFYADKIKIDEALNGQEALKKLKSKNYDLIIMDIRMPEMDGYETTTYIREKLSKPKNEIPILGLSAYVVEEEIEKGKLSGMNDFLSKPINPEKLIKKIQKLTGRKTDNKIKAESAKNKKETKNVGTLNLSFFENLFKNDRTKINKTLLVYSKEIPIQLEYLKTSLENEQFENLKLTGHSMKSTFKYIGRSDMSETARQIEQLSVTKKDKHLIKKKIDFLISNWKLLEYEIKNLLEQ
ncbi:MAG: response regulator [Bacteroidota bacterium]